MIEFEAQKRDFGKNKDPSHYFEVPLLMKDFPDGKYYDDTGTVNIFQCVTPHTESHDVKLANSKSAIAGAI